MSPSKLHEWVHASAEQKSLYAQESLIVDIAEEIWAVLKEEKISKVDLAAKLGKSKAFVTQVLDGSRNMTLRTLADIASALDRKVCISLRPHHESHPWKDIGSLVITRLPVVSSLHVEVSNDSSWHDVLKIPSQEAA